MFSKLNFLGVARATKTTAIAASATTLAKAVAGVATKFAAMAKFTDFATNVATLARFATAKAVAIRSAKLAIIAILATFATATLTGCDEAKSLAASVSIEEPLVEIAYNSNGYSYLSIQSQDNETSIEDIIINRGNCLVEKYELVGNLTEQFKKYCATHPDRCGKDITSWSYDTKLRTQSGELFQLNGSWSALFSDEKSMDYYNALDDESKTLYKPIYPIKLPYGKKFSPNYTNCSADTIIEVELVVNGGGRLTYKFK